jgi:mRNA-degrading endonuclease RelE of RelBE toxin-antitoxin system
MGIWKVKIMRKAVKKWKISMPREREMVFSNTLKTRKSKGGEKNF